MANDKELVKKMLSVKLGTADMINMMKKILMKMDEMQITSEEHNKK